jgi:aryl-alcohol dehydrogenase-like predicted oxidoreductase
MTMAYGRITGVDKPVARIVQGTVMITPQTLDTSFALLDAVFAQGGTTFDTAENYRGGDCERVFGRWLRERGLRDDVVILGKGAHPYDGRQRVTPADLRADVDSSLEHMGIDRIDLYLLHRDDPTVPVGPIVEALDTLRTSGKIGAYGGSNWSAARLAEANDYAGAHGMQPFVASSPNYSLAVQVQAPWQGCLSISGPDAAGERAWHADHGMALLPWSSLAGGFFSGRFRRENVHTFDNAQDRLCVATYGLEPNFRRLDRAEVLARQRGVSLPQIAMAYVLNGPLDTFALTGASSGAHFGENVESLGVRLTDQELAWLDLRVDER